ncbi:MAG: hypothetical protein FWF54_03460 [Candidatus Azobacteroides sp.]|nr:hypothetical protein [Candidatus Azobacteroides sp.]
MKQILSIGQHVRHGRLLTLNTLRTYGTPIVWGNIFSTNILSLTGQKATFAYPVRDSISVKFGFSLLTLSRQGQNIYSSRHHAI